MLATAARWPVGIALTSWRYMWRTTPLRRKEVPGAVPADAPPPLPPGVDQAEVQLPEDGAGALFHRVYSAVVRDPELSVEDVFRALREDLNQVAPSEFASFEKVHGEQGEMRVGDEYVVRMPGPWDGPVRVADVTPTSFRFVTLAGHLEAGQIEFRATSDDRLRFSIESWARSGDRLSDMLYDRFRMSKEIQLHMWTSLIERVAKLAGGRLTGGIEIQTRRVEAPAGEGRRPLGDARARRALDALHGKELNFDLHARDRMTAANGWLVDDYRQPLPPEAPGPPAPGGSWEVASDLMRNYEFADPSIVRAVYHADQPLEGRDMLLELRYHGLRFHAGVRVGGVIDETRTVEGREVRVWGWSYRTLQGHLEMGQMDYELWKWLDSGEVEFRIHVASRAARIGNPLKRIGFRLVGRREQVRFARRACERMAKLTAARLPDRAGEVPEHEALPRAAEEVLVQPLAARE
jgi:uncharacterized protein (UPF0548 family)